MIIWSVKTSNAPPRLMLKTKLSTCDLWHTVQAVIRNWIFFCIKYVCKIYPENINWWSFTLNVTPCPPRQQLCNYIHQDSRFSLLHKDTILFHKDKTTMIRQPSTTKLHKNINVYINIINKNLTVLYSIFCNKRPGAWLF